MNHKLVKAPKPKLNYMIKLLHNPFLLVFLMIVNLGYSQVNHSSDTNHIDVSLDAQLHQEIDSNTIEKEGFSYKNTQSEHSPKISNEEHDHDHHQGVSLLDIISSDEGADFNCSGGFCMNEAHFHKKGLTLKRQLFVYFMSISC